MYVPIREPTELELESLPRIMLTSDATWDPGMINNGLDGQVMFPNEDDILDDDMKAYIFEAHRDVDPGRTIPEDEMQSILEYINGLRWTAPTTTDPDTNYSKFQAHLGWAPLDKVEATFQNTTQLAKYDAWLSMQKHYKLNFPQLNRPHFKETFCTDTSFHWSVG